MSLQIWLPLIEDTHNQGLLGNFPKGNSQSATNVFSETGKIGAHCLSYDENLTTYFANLSTNDMISMFGTGKKFSISWWMKMKITDTSTSVIQIGYTGETIYPTIPENGLRLFSVYFNKSSGSLGVPWGNKNTNATTMSAASYTNPEEWHHFCCTIDSKTNSLIGQFYFDGELVNSRTTPVSSADWVSLNTTNANNYICLRPKYAAFNDFRIYDHILSQKEVEELAKGLVLHYPLNDGYCEETTNLLTAERSYPEETDIPFSSTSTTWGVYWGYTITNSVYTLSAYINNISNQSIRVILSTKKKSDNSIANVAWGNWIGPGEKGWSKCTYTILSTEVENYIRVGLGADAAQNTVTPLPKVQFFQLEAKDHQTPWVLGGITRTPTIVYDCSGYSNNGTIVGSLTAAAPSPRYDVATDFDSSSYIRYEHIMSESSLQNEYTYATWIKRTYTDAATKYFSDGSLQVYLYSDFKFRVTWSAAQTDGTYSNNTWATGVLLPANEWHHIAFTFKDGLLSCYFDGVSQGTSARPPLIRGVKGTNGTAGSQLIGELSDVRIYATALTEDQVKELYNTSMSIDASGNIYARQLSNL